MQIDKPLVMGILNVTPDSFSDGGKFNLEDQAVKRFEEMIEEGADIIDIGGESTGPGSQDVSLKEELERVIPILQRVRKISDVWISVDTYKAKVAKQALDAGANMINDVLAFRGDARMLDVVKESDVPIVLMYSKDPTGRTTGKEKNYEDVVEHIKIFLEERIKLAEQNGIKKERIIVDPGQGAFVSSDPKYSLQILDRLQEFKTLGVPILIGSSRKSVVGQTLNLPLHQRLEGSLACAAVAVMNGASIIRAHDVKETRRLIDMVDAIGKS
ncbi:dihydropteroate synthase [Patescibacteria group bacterium]